MSVNEEIREQRKKLQGASFKAHLEYFWDYYKIHTIVALIAVIFIVTIVRDIANNKPYALYAIFINSEGIDVQTYLQDGYAQYAGIDTQKEAVLVDTTANYVSSSLDTSAVATSEKVLAMISAKSLDVMVADDNSFGHFAGQETFLDLRNVFSDEELASMEDDLFYIDQAFIDYLASDEYKDFILSGKYDSSNRYAVMAAEYDETLEFPDMDVNDMQTPVPVGIRITDSVVLKESGAYTSFSPIAGIVTNTQQIANSKSFIEYLKNN